MQYKWTPLAHATKYNIYDNGKLAIKAGATGVEVAFGQSSRKLMENGKWTGRMQNAYRHNGSIYNA